MVVSQKIRPSQDEKNIVPYMLFMYKSQLRLRKKQKYKIPDSFDYKYNLTKELVRENLIQARKEKRRCAQAYELGLMYDKLASERAKRADKKREGPKKV